MTLQDIDLRYVRSRNGLYTPRNLAVGGNLTVDGTITASGNPLTAPSEPQPNDHGLIAWTGNPWYSTTSSTAAVNGTLYLSRLFIRAATTISKIWWINSGAGSGAVAGQNWVGLISASGTVLSTGSTDAVAVTTGPQNGTLATPQAVTPGAYWGALLINATGTPTLTRSAGLTATGNNVNLTAANYRYAVNGTALTAIPATITPTSNSLTGALALWMAFS